MKIKELKKDGLHYEMEVTVEASEIDRKIDERLHEVGKTLKLPGFRPGKVPLNILKQRYGRSVMGDVLEVAVNDTTTKALQEKGLRPALQPKVEVKQFDEGKDLTYTVAVELMPEFKIMDLKAIKVEKPVTKPEKKAIDETLERIAKQNSESEPIKSPRGAKEGDILIIDFHGKTKAGKAYPGMHSHDHRLELGSNQFIPGFEPQLVGKKAGEKVHVEVTFPTPYHMAELAGVEAIFDVDIKEIHEPKTAEINDEFAKKLGFDNEKALRETIEKQIKSQYDQFSRMKMKRGLLDALDEGHTFPIPSGLMNMEFDSILRQIKAERQAETVKGKPELTKDEEEELHAIAERRVRLGMVLAEIGRLNNIQVQDQELQRAVIMEAQRYPGQEAEVFEFFRKNRQALESLRAPVFEDKVIDFIAELASVTEKEVTLEELTAEDEESYLEKKGGKSSKSSGKAEEGKGGGSDTKKASGGKKAAK